MPTYFIFILVFFCDFHCIVGTAIASHGHRRFLHQPFFFPQDSFPPTQPPSSSPPEPQGPKFPFSSTTNSKPFFPSVLSPPPPPSPSPPSSLATFPANISSLLVPHYPHSKHSSPKIVLVVLVILAVLAVLLVSSFAFFLYLRRRRHGFSKDEASGLDSHRLYPANTAPSDGQQQERGGSSAASSEFLYLGTLVNPRGADSDVNARNVRVGSTGSSGSSPYQKLDSPELHPLPPLSRKIYQRNYRNGGGESEEEEEEEGGEQEQFYSPNGAPTSSRKVFSAMCSSTPSCPSSHSASPTCLSPETSRMNSSGSQSNLSSPQPVGPVLGGTLAQNGKSSALLSPSSVQIREVSGKPVSRKIPEPISGPPVLVAPSGPVGFLKRTTVPQVELQRNEELWKPKLKPLHWGKVRASSDGACTFKLNEEMDEPLFIMHKKTNSTPQGTTQQKVLAPSNQENTVLDLKKSQSIAVLLRALNVTTEEVCQALLEGNTGTLGTALLGSLLKMAPTRDEESKLKEYKNDSLYNLGPAEQFLRAVLDIPFAFKRLDAMLYIANFDSEVEYLRMSFEVLKAACEELRNSRMFLKLLEAVLNAGNQINVGMNCGDACAFELDTLLKLVDVKGADGKTGLLHFVVQEITRDEGFYLSGGAHIPADGIMQRKLIDRIGEELKNVNKAAEMDYDVLSNDVSELARGIGNVGEVVQLNEANGMKESNWRFSESMNKFLKKAEGEIIMVQAQESVAFSAVKEVTAYFHGKSAKKEADPFRIFRVVNDLLSILNQVCKEVERNNEKTLINP